MEVGLHANMCDQATRGISKALSVPFTELSALLEGDYGGVMEHLWIDLELIKSHSRPDGRARFPFRFAKRVSGRSHFGLPPSPDKFNVGHYSVRPDFQLIASLPLSEAVVYALSLIYDSTRVLIDKQKRLGGFDASSFRRNFLAGCRKVGYEISENPP
jgi:hypothetical protein